MRPMDRLRVFGFLVLTGALPLLQMGCLHQPGCQSCRAGSSRPAASDPAMSPAIGATGRAPAANAPATAKRQTICPVTGQKLGSMGRPIPVSANGETIYVCCQGCVEAVQAEPAKYLAIVHSGGG
jgi:hypothetical protein